MMFSTAEDIGFLISYAAICLIIFPLLNFVTGSSLSRAFIDQVLDEFRAKTRPSFELERFGETRRSIKAFSTWPIDINYSDGAT